MQHFLTGGQSNYRWINKMNKKNRGKSQTWKTERNSTIRAHAWLNNYRNSSRLSFNMSPNAVQYQQNFCFFIALLPPTTLSLFRLFLCTISSLSFPPQTEKIDGFGPKNMALRAGDCTTVCFICTNSVFVCMQMSMCMYLYKAKASFVRNTIGLQWCSPFFSVKL